MCCLKKKSKTNRSKQQLTFLKIPTQNPPQLTVVTLPPSSCSSTTRQGKLLFYRCIGNPVDSILLVCLFFCWPLRKRASERGIRTPFHSTIPPQPLHPAAPTQPCVGFGCSQQGCSNGGHIKKGRENRLGVASHKNHHLNFSSPTVSLMVCYQRSQSPFPSMVKSRAFAMHAIPQLAPIGF